MRGDGPPWTDLPSARGRDGGGGGGGGARKAEAFTVSFAPAGPSSRQSRRPRDDRSSHSAAPAPAPARPFLRKGEGVGSMGNLATLQAQAGSSPAPPQRTNSARRSPRQGGLKSAIADFKRQSTKDKFGDAMVVLPTRPPPTRAASPPLEQSLNDSGLSGSGAGAHGELDNDAAAAEPSAHAPQMVPGRREQQWGDAGERSELEDEGCPPAARRPARREPPEQRRAGADARRAPRAAAPACHQDVWDDRGPARPLHRSRHTDADDDFSDGLGSDDGQQAQDTGRGKSYLDGGSEDEALDHPVARGGGGGAGGFFARDRASDRGSDRGARRRTDDPDDEYQRQMDRKLRELDEAMQRYGREADRMRERNERGEQADRARDRRSQAEEAAAELERVRQEVRKLRREKSTLQERCRGLAAAQPAARKDREDLEALQEEMALLKEEWRQKEQRQKQQLLRLQKQVTELQDRNSYLNGLVKRAQMERLEHQKRAPRDGLSSSQLSGGDPLDPDGPDPTGGSTEEDSHDELALRPAHSQRDRERERRHAEEERRRESERAKAREREERERREAEERERREQEERLRRERRAREEKRRKDDERRRRELEEERLRKQEEEEERRREEQRQREKQEREKQQEREEQERRKEKAREEEQRKAAQRSAPTPNRGAQRAGAEIWSDPGRGAPRPGGGPTAQSSMQQGHDVGADTPPADRPAPAPRHPQVADNEPEPVDDDPSDIQVDTKEYGDGKVERFYKSKKKEVVYTNGTRKIILPTGHVVLRFNNDDVRKTYPSGKVVYYYFSAQTRHTTYKDGLQIFEFESNKQVERHYPDGMKEIIFPDGTLKYIYPDGGEESIFPDGTVQRGRNP